MLKYVDVQGVGEMNEASLKQSLVILNIFTYLCLQNIKYLVVCRTLFSCSSLSVYMKRLHWLCYLVDLDQNKKQQVLKHCN